MSLKKIMLLADDVVFMRINKNNDARSSSICIVQDDLILTERGSDYHHVYAVLGIVTE